MATYRDQLQDWREFSSERRGHMDQFVQVALIEAPAALQYDPEDPPSGVMSRLGPPVLTEARRELEVQEAGKQE